MKTCIVDFDETLLELDSITYILKKERLFLRLPILFWGSLFFILRPFLPRAKQFFFRRRLKFLILQAINEIGEKKIFEKYSELFAQHLNDDLTRFVSANYDIIYVVSSSFKPLIEMTLEKRGISNFKVFGTVFNPVFSDFDICWNIKKVPVIEKNNIGEFDLFTDSYDDRPLMEKAKNTFLVSKSKWSKL